MTVTTHPVLEASERAKLSDQVLDTLMALPGWKPKHHAMLASELPEVDRRLSIYPASAGFELLDELDYLASRSIERNVFFEPRYLAPAMPRLDDREVFLAVLRDEDKTRSRLRFLLPYSIERPGLGIGPSVIRGWTTPFGPAGAPLIDSDEPVQIMNAAFSLLAQKNLKLPNVMVLPDMPLDGPAAAAIRTAAISSDLPISIMEGEARPVLQATGDPDEYFAKAISGHHRRNYNRLRRRLQERGTVSFDIIRQPDEIRQATETFLTLELMSWKGKVRSAMASDRYQAAFAREAIYRLAERDMVRIATLKLDGETIASLIVLLAGGTAYTWKTAFDETLKDFSPGVLLMIDTTEYLIDDPNIVQADSCATENHSVMSRLWNEKRTYGTFVVGLTPGSDRAVNQTSRQLHLYRGTRNIARDLRDRIRRVRR
ncbi:GNAT family N-acetyltransferase [Notoacmeibacter ruber]|uniref:GNAT family N-acetyltransferase n=1 Tax=Notoacmeibacter ruber TaxID=2670375 RepID=A0A3L7JE51_9HYPH|nr:GNAT family N-acetyltransferase [Notoacmeibacter ruber]RLQ88589.1 GNAT family N-acetyltransferase [Notoacmeibacter ruber]